MVAPPEPRAARAADAAHIARLHVAAWAETYADLLPASEIAAQTVASRQAQWRSALTAATGRIALVPGVGFAAAGPQRDAGLAHSGYGQELYAIYVLGHSQGKGIGRALLRAVVAPGGGRMTALVLSGNHSAIAFYKSTGARPVLTRPEVIGTTQIIEIAFGWDDPAALIASLTT